MQLQIDMEQLVKIHRNVWEKHLKNLVNLPNPHVLCDTKAGLSIPHIFKY